MTLIHVSNGGPTRIILDGRRKWRFEDHPHCGPVVIDKEGTPIDQPPEDSAFWTAVELWYAQGKRTQKAGVETWCVWDKPTMQKMWHLGGRHYELITDTKEQA